MFHTDTIDKCEPLIFSEITFWIDSDGPKWLKFQFETANPNGRELVAFSEYNNFNGTTRKTLTSISIQS